MKEANDLFIASNSARLVSVTNQAARGATPEVTGIKEKKDDEGNVVTKGRKAQPALEGRDAMSFMKISANNETIMKEIIVRMAIDGILQKPNTEIEPHVSGVTAIFMAANQSMIRASFKKSKGTGEHNAKGLAIMKADKKAKAAKAAEKKKADEKAKAEKEEKENPKKEAKKETKKPAAKKTAKKPAKKAAKKDDDEDWG